MKNLDNLCRKFFQNYPRATKFYLSYLNNNSITTSVEYKGEAEYDNGEGDSNNKATDIGAVALIV